MTGQVAGILFDGVAYGMLLFLIALGLSVTMGMMGFVHLAHGVFAMAGGYLAVWLLGQGWPFLATLPAAFCAAAAAGALAERLLYRRLYGRGALEQVLFTLGLVLAAGALAIHGFGPGPQAVRLPDWLQGQWRLAGVDVGIYRVFLIACGVALAALVGALASRTLFGARVRAAVERPDVAAALGLDVGRLFAWVFALGCGLAGLGGALGVQVLGLDPHFAVAYLAPILIVVAVGGLGSIAGTLLAACVVGVLDVLGKYYLPQTGAFIVYAVALAALLWRPGGWLGRRA